MNNLNKFYDKIYQRLHHSFKKITKTKNIKLVLQPKHLLLCISTSAVLSAIFTIYLLKKQKITKDKISSGHERSIEPIAHTTRELRFRKFASSVYNNQLFMTPEDFLHSFLIGWSRNPRFYRNQLSKHDIEAVRRLTPSVKDSSPTFLRNLGNRGLISYVDYIFLLGVLMMPLKTFELTFNSMDRNLNGLIEKPEYLLLAKALKDTVDFKTQEENKLIDDLESEDFVNTTLLVHFFGPDGSENMSLNEFKMFMENLQTEIIELDFITFSKGLSEEISQVVFAEILLRYSTLDSKEHAVWIQRLKDRIKEPKGITFEEFHNFFHFLNELSDFSVALKLYSGYQPISKDEFVRAVKISTGVVLSDNLVSTLFALFDVDGDGYLSCKEFIYTLKEYVLRGLKKNLENEGLQKFRKCLRMEKKNKSSKFV